MAICPGCGRPLRREREGEGKYFCENKNCNVVFVVNPDELNRVRVAYTGFARYKETSCVSKESSKHSTRPGFRII
jgi:hypothetical protein